MQSLEPTSSQQTARLAEIMRSKRQVGGERMYTLYFVVSNCSHGSLIENRRMGSLQHQAIATCGQNKDRTGIRPTRLFLSYCCIAIYAVDTSFHLLSPSVFRLHIPSVLPPSPRTAAQTLSTTRAESQLNIMWSRIVRPFVPSVTRVASVSFISSPSSSLLPSTSPSRLCSLSSHSNSLSTTLPRFISQFSYSTISGKKNPVTTQPHDNVQFIQTINDYR